jgi:BirA family biotin operon repressor/biotin-[acetyl-CoA-carboxylase] ligase
MPAVRVVVHETIGSTNADALERARAGERGPLWIVAKRQTAGRGRRGRTWVSEPGNLYATLLLTDASPPERAAELSFVAGLAVHDAVAGRIPGLTGRLSLKWPNDCLIEGCKFAGILIEGEGTAIAIGIGINCTHHPADTAFPATDLAAAGIRARPDSVFEALSEAMIGRVVQWNRGEGFAAIRKDWLDRAHARNESIRVTGSDGECTGRFETIDQSGHLVLRQPDGTTRAIAAGDVAPLTPPRRAVQAGR